MNIPELLAPAGSLEVLKAAVNAGADAVYFGGKAFNARASAANFTLEEMAEAARFCAARGVRTYLTLNTLVKQSEWDDFKRYVHDALATGITALIVTDIGVAAYVREHFPTAKLHASTQMNIHEADGARFAEAFGFERVVLARELSITEIARIHRETSAELEVFAHGALCYCYSGRCLMSSYIGGRSGNRGRCAQSCRLKYRPDGRRAEYAMNLKDLCALPHLAELARAGVASLKIEGRLKGVPYVVGVTKLYRKALDYVASTGNNYEPTAEEMTELSLLFNRGGFTDGYLTGQKREMICAESPKHGGVPFGAYPAADGDTIELVTSAEPFPSYIYKSGMKLPDGDLRLLISRNLNARLSSIEEKKVPIEAKAVFCVGRPPKMIIRGKVTEIDEVVQLAQNVQTDEATIRRQLEKTGGTAYTITKLEIEKDDRVFVPIRVLNALRREALAQLVTLNVPQERPLDDTAELAPATATQVVAICRTPSQLAAAGENAIMAGNLIGPRDGQIAYHYGQLGADAIVGEGIGVMNRKAAAVLLQKAGRVIVSPELDVDSQLDIAGQQTGIYAYGRLPAMITAQKVAADMLVDRCDDVWPVHRVTDYTVIDTCEPICLYAQLKAPVAFGTLYLNFTDETPEQVAEIVQAFCDLVAGKPKTNEYLLSLKKGWARKGVE